MSLYASAPDDGEQYAGRVILDDDRGMVTDMSPDAARQLAADLLSAADHAEHQVTMFTATANLPDYTPQTFPRASEAWQHLLDEVTDRFGWSDNANTFDALTRALARRRWDLPGEVRESGIVLSVEA